MSGKSDLSTVSVIGEAIEQHQQLMPQSSKAHSGSAVGAGPSRLQHRCMLTSRDLLLYSERDIVEGIANFKFLGTYISHDQLVPADAAAQMINTWLPLLEDLYGT